MKRRKSVPQKRIEVFMPHVETRDRMANVLSSFSRNHDAVMGQHRVNAKKIRDRIEVRRRELMKDPTRKTLARIRSRITTLIRIRAAKKTLRTRALIGCSISQFMWHIRNQFEAGMCWENHGQWELDHVIPCRAFDVRCPDQLRACFNYSNYQPMWKGPKRSLGPCPVRLMPCPVHAPELHVEHESDRLLRLGSADRTLYSHEYVHVMCITSYSTQNIK